MQEQGYIFELYSLFMNGISTTESPVNETDAPVREIWMSWKPGLIDKIRLWKAWFSPETWEAFTKKPKSFETAETVQKAIGRVLKTSVPIVFPLEEPQQDKPWKVLYYYCRDYRR